MTFTIVYWRGRCGDSQKNFVSVQDSGANRRIFPPFPTQSNNVIPIEATMQDVTKMLKKGG